VQIRELKVGDKFPVLSFTLEPDKVKDYIEAVEESSGYFAQWSQGEVAPPIACASLAVATLFKDMELPAGTVHLSQEITLTRPVRVGQTLLVRAVVIRNQVRRNLHIMTLQLKISDEGDDEVLEGKTGFIFPEQGDRVS